ncbi:uncharacterized protein LOC128865935 isoform X1 [Anastrepha ludens]|uniref:uncharacterized protein LOC128865935 isoform X1 n=1 Tax=Anastrepha ludens TaxID=28586 RepID=UPI0023AE86C4|nr:uncharacterized protein LOC128865935 isoform X1 [Anastrepha ludens]
MSGEGVPEARSRNVMPTTSLKPMETLKGIFSVPKMERNRRNFLRENKLSLRELQRVTNKNKMQQQQEQMMREQKYIGRRSQSQQRSNNNNGLDKQGNTRCPSLSRVPSGRAVGGSVTGGFGDGANHHIRNGLSRTNSTTTVKSVHKQVQTEDIQDEQFLYDALKRCSANDCQSRLNDLQTNLVQSSHHTAFDAQSRNSFYPPPIDDIDQRGFENTDENLYTAQQQSQMQDKYEQHNKKHQYAEQNYNGQQQEEAPDIEDVVGTESVERLYGPEASSKYNFAPTPRSQQHFTNGYNMGDSDGLPATTTMQSSYEPPDQQQQHQQQPVRYRMQPHVQDDVRSTFENMSLNNGTSGGIDCDVGADGGINGGVEAVCISGRSRRTNFSQNSQQSNTDLTKKRSNGSIHKLGSRDNLSLPRYLEREKREKEEQLQRQSERDPNCPPGHYPLPDKERQAALQSAETRFKALVNELNHMPMTTETLRMRVRKAEIEKELKLLETDIRVFSKTKVYMKHKE